VVATSEPVSPTSPGWQPVGLRWASPSQPSGGVELLVGGRAASRLLADPTMHSLRSGNEVLLCAAMTSCARHMVERRPTKSCFSRGQRI
jgi:hypothetical protein